MQTTPIIKLRAVRDVGDVLNDTFRFARQNAGPLAKSLLFIAGPFTIPTALGSVLMQYANAGLDPVSMTGGDLVSWMGTFFGAFLLVWMFGTVASALSMGVVYGAMRLYETNGPGSFDVGDLWAEAKAHFWKILGSILLLSLFFGVGILIVIIPCLGIIAYVVGVVYFAVVFAIFFPMLVHEEIDVIDGIKRARFLVKEHWWETFAICLIAGIIIAILSILFSIPYYIVMGTAGLLSLQSGPVDIDGLTGVLMVICGLISTLGGTLLYGILFTATGLQYFNLVEQKERPGLMAQIDALDTPAASGPNAHPSS